MREAAPAPDDRAWRGGSRGGGFGNRFFIYLAGSPIGRVLGPVCIFWVALYFAVASPQARRASSDLAKRLGRRPAVFVFCHFFTFGLMLFDRMIALFRHDAISVDRRGLDPVRAAAAAGVGIVAVTAHQGNAELMAQTLAGAGVPVTLVMHDGMTGRARAALEELAARRAFQVIFNDGTVSAAAAILGAVRAGRVVGMMGDRLLGSRGVDVSFLGGTAELPIGPWIIAVTSAAPVYHVFAERVGPRRYVYRGIERGVLSYADRRDKGADHERWCARFAADLEELVRRRPYQWCNFYPFWKGS